MAIKVGDQLPSTKFRIMTGEGPAWKTTDEIFKGKKVALFAVPGAFTGVCSKQHLPSVVQNTRPSQSPSTLVFPHRSPASTRSSA